MKNSTLISIDVFCQENQLEMGFMQSLHEFGVIEIVFENEKGFIATEYLGAVQKAVSFHHDLAINLEGIEVILRLLNQLAHRQSEITALKNQLGIYERQSETQQQSV